MTIKKPEITLLHTYKNGGYEVEIYNDGTKIRKQISDDPPITPESIDLKITNKCDLSQVCKWCHEDSDAYGNNANLSNIADILSDLPAGAELAIGGGNALVHPELLTFLHIMRERGIICNITINQRHINAHKDLITTLIKDELVHGIGVSKSGDKSVAWLYELTDNIVFHVIAGINTIDEILMFPKILVLGYKDIGRGQTYLNRNPMVKNNINNWKQGVHEILGNNKVISFDNLALKQLEIKKLITNEKWNEIYMGDDATFTYYIDAVRQRFGPSSTGGSPYGYMKSSAEMLAYIRLTSQEKITNIYKRNNRLIIN